MKDSRSKANARDKARHRWVKKGDGDNRASLRKAIAAIVDPKVRRAKRKLMQHRQDIAHLRQHPLSGADPTIRNILKAVRKSRR